MKNLKLLMLIGFTTLSWVSLKAQQEAMFTHYMYNTLLVNPAYAGSKEALTGTLLHRSQWVDFKGGPITQTLTIHGPLKSQKIGLGGSVVNDKIGPVKTMAAYIDFAYIAKLTEKSNLAFGLKGGVNSMHVNLNALELDDQTDAAFQNNINNKVLPNFGFGMYFSNERFYAGLSIPKLLENNFRTEEAKFATDIREQVRHYYFIAGAVFKLSETVELKPTTLVKVTKAAPIEADITANFIYKKKLTLGAMYRTGDAYGLLVGFNLTPQVHLGYSYDMSYGLKTITYNKGTHEIMLSYDFAKDVTKIKTPRFF